MCGGLVKQGDIHFIRANLPIDELSAQTFCMVMSSLLNIADALEQKYVGGDDF
jgi:hypothetical protein